MTDMLTRPPGAAPDGPTPPQALDAERAVLSALLLENEAIGRALEHLEPSAFYRVAHQKIYAAVIALFNRNENADLVTVTEELRKRGELEAIGGPSALAQLMDYATTTANLDSHIKIIHSKAILRSLITSAREIQEEAFAGSDETSQILDRAEARIFAITDQRVREGFVALKDLLKPAFEHIQHLFERKVLVTGVDTGYDDLNKMTAGLQNSDLVILAGRPSMGKCLTAGTLIDDPDTGERVTIERYVRERRPRVFGVNRHGRVRKTAVGAWIDSGVKPAFRVRTRLGREVEVTGHHPFLTTGGWRPLHDLAIGARIGVPRRVGAFGTDRSWSPQRARLLAYFIAEGGLTGGCPQFTNTDPLLLADFDLCLAQEFPDVATKDAGDGITWRVALRPDLRRERNGENANPVTAWLRSLGLMGKRSDEKRVPEAVWRLERGRLAGFLRTLLSCDGTVYSMSGYPRIEFTVASPELAQDVQHLLTRFGIVSKLWRKTERSWRVEITEPESVADYYREIGWNGEKSGRFSPLLVAIDARARHAVAGNAEPETWALVRTAASARGLSLAEAARAAGEPVARGCNLHVRRGITRGRLARFADTLRSPELRRASSPDLYWDEIVAIEPLGPQQVYDLTVPDGSNFIAADVCVHNTSFALNLAENAAIRARVPVAVFSLEMSKEQLVQRLLCSQAEVPLHRLRNGHLSNEDWPRLTTAAGLLTQAPIMIDDSSALTVMEVRAKCRRLKAEGKLGLLVIDYLQLLRGHMPAENRVQEISTITRNLKALAKELGVPIVALSQLSRQVETRDKSGRPQLSDLRESGSIEQDADVVMFVYREVVYNRDTPEPGKAQIIIAKQRNGPTGEVDLTFLRECTKFVPYSPLMPDDVGPGF